jgi:hypothetical protein
MGWLRRQLASLAALAETQGGTITVVAAALAVWWIQAIAMSLGQGRDFGTHAGAFVEIIQSDPIGLGYVLGRTPIAPLVTGGLLAQIHGALAEPGMSLLYAGSILAWFLAARRFGGASRAGKTNGPSAVSTCSTSSCGRATVRHPVRSPTLFVETCSHTSRTARTELRCSDSSRTRLHGSSTTWVRPRTAGGAGPPTRRYFATWLSTRFGHTLARTPRT